MNNDRKRFVELRPELHSAFLSLLSELEALPAGRQKSLAVTSLQDSFAHAVWAANVIDDPIRMRPPPVRSV